MKTPVGLVLLLLGLVAGASSAPVTTCNEKPCATGKTYACCAFKYDAANKGAMGEPTCQENCDTLDDSEKCTENDCKAPAKDSPGKCKTSDTATETCKTIHGCCVINDKKKGIGKCEPTTTCGTTEPANKCTFPHKAVCDKIDTERKTCIKGNAVKVCNGADVTCCNTKTGECVKKGDCKLDGETMCTMNGKACTEADKTVKYCSKKDTPTKKNYCTAEETCCTKDKGECTKSCNDKTCTIEGKTCKAAAAGGDGGEDHSPATATPGTGSSNGSTNATPTSGGTKKTNKPEESTKGATTAVATGPLLAGLLLLPILIPNNN